MGPGMLDLPPLPALLLALPTAAAAQDPPVDFARDVRPILSDNCYLCHGFDAETREAGLRLDTREGAFGELRSGGAAVVPGDLDASELAYRILAEPGERMPPVDSGRELTAEEIDVLRRWVAQGAPWEEHWSFVPPERPEPPAVERADWPLGPLDAFVLARLEEEGLAPSPDASKEALLRRVTFDLTGLPPTVEEQDAFLADDEPGAYERVVDRLLASPRYGEHMARYWLDAARYGDTHGLHLDNERSMWRFREWVIAALNENKPFDEFTVEQLAGDLLPDPSLDQLIASGFNRCNVTSAEGGMIAEEYLALYAKDRVDTTATVWMGLTLGCAQCHEHKYDPFSQREYYELFAFFNSLAEEASDRNIANPVPFVRAPSPEQERELEGMRSAVEALARKVDAPMPAVDEAQVRWEEEQADLLSDRWRILVPAEATAAEGTTLMIRDDDSILATGASPAKDVFEVRAHAAESRITAVRLEALVGGGGSDKVPGRAHNQNFVLTGFEVEAFPVGRPELARPVAFVDALATFSQQKYPIAAAIDGKKNTGWGGLGLEGSRTAVFVPEEPFGFEGGTMLRVRLRHESGFAEHAINRFRLAVAEDPDLSYSELGTWHRVGPFVEANGRASLEKEYAPELGVDLTSTCGPEAMPWVPQPDYVDGKVHLFNPDVGAMFLYRTIDAPTARSLRAGIGSRRRRADLAERRADPTTTRRRAEWRWTRTRSSCRSRRGATSSCSRSPTTAAASGSRSAAWRRRSAGCRWTSPRSSAAPAPSGATPRPSACGSTSGAGTPRSGSP